jgi:site-specific recombinase XerD
VAEGHFLACFEEYLVSLGMAPATIANYLVDIRDLSSWLGGQGLPLLNADTNHIRHYCQALRRQGRSVSTTNRRLQAVRKFYDFAVQAGLSPDNPAREVERLSEHSAAPPRVLTADEAGELLRAVGDGMDSLARRDRAILLLLLETGLRPSELVDLRVEDVVLQAGSGYVLVGQDMESGGRCLPIGSEACAALRACMRVRAPAFGVDHLFVSRLGQPLSVRSVQRLVSDCAQAAGLEGVSVHSLRHTFAHDVLEETQDPSEVARALGLRDIAGMRRYRE